MKLAALLLALLVRAASAVNPVPSVSAHLINHISLEMLPDASDSSTKVMPSGPPPVTDHVVPLKRGPNLSTSAAYVKALTAKAKLGISEDALATAVIPLESVDGGLEFLIQVSVGGTDYYMILDTGSSDPWLAETGFQCIDFYTGDDAAESDCGFGPLYDPAKSSTYSAISDENFNITYGDSASVTGSMGYEQFTIGGLTVSKQEFGVVNSAYWQGDDISTGLIGFAYPILTSAFSGSNGDDDSRYVNSVFYDPFFVNLYNESQIASVFSIAIDRDPSVGGVLALGGIPDIALSPTFVTTPMNGIGVYAGSSTPIYSFYNITIDGFAISTSPWTQFASSDNPPSGSTKTPLLGLGTTSIVDSGTSLVLVEPDIMDAVASAFVPPAVYNDTYGLYTVDCDSVAPLFGISIEGKIFYVNPIDLVIADGPICLCGVQTNGGLGTTILGDVWMKNVLSVFDVGNSVMQFAAREYYSLTNASVQDTTSG